MMSEYRTFLDLVAEFALGLVASGCSATTCLFHTTMRRCLARAALDRRTCFASRRSSRSSTQNPPGIADHLTCVLSQFKPSGAALHQAEFLLQRLLDTTQRVIGECNA